MIETIETKYDWFDIAVITDCRFKNEYEALKNLPKDMYDVKFIHVDRGSSENEFSTHASEKDIQTFECDVTIKNDADLNDLRDRLIDLKI